MKKNYKYGFSSNIKSNTFEKGLSKEIIEKISKLKNEPKYILDFRLEAFFYLQKLTPPSWGNFPPVKIDLQNICYYSAPKKSQAKEIKETFNKLKIPLKEKNNIALDVILDSVSVATTYQKRLKECGVILCPISEAILKHPELVKKYLGSVVSREDNYYATLNSAVFSDGTFVFVPKGVKCPLELSTYFRINEKSLGQFERTLIIAEEKASLSYLEGCTAPAYDVNQLHAAVVELIALEDATIKYSTVQNWYGGDENGKGGIYNFVTKRGLCKGNNSKISWAQVELGSLITWKYPGCILEGENSSGEFYSIALTSGKMQADTGSKMIHIGKNSKSLIMAKTIAADYSSSCYRGLVKMLPSAKNSRNYTSCDSMLVGKNSSTATFPSIESTGFTEVEHEATTCKMNEEQIFYLQTRGFNKEEAIHLIVNGFCKDVIKQLPLEFAMEANELLSIRLERSIG